MATEILIKNGTAIVLADSTDHSPAADNNLGTRTAQMDLTSLAAGSYWQSVKVDFGATRAARWEATAVFEPTSAPTAGGSGKVYVGYSHSTTAATGNPGNATGADGAYVGYGAAASDADEAIHQFDYIGEVVFSNDAIAQLGHLGTFTPKQQYGVVIVKNNSSVAFIADAVEMSIRLSPLVDEAQTA